MRVQERSYRVTAGRERVLSGGGELLGLGAAFDRLGIDRVLVVCEDRAQAELGRVISVLGSRVVAVFDELGESSTSRAVFAAADVAVTSDAEGVVAFGRPGPVDLVEAMRPVVDLPGVVVAAPTPSTVDDHWALGSPLTTGREQDDRLSWIDPLRGDGGARYGMRRPSPLCGRPEPWGAGW